MDNLNSFKLFADPIAGWSNFNPEFIYAKAVHPDRFRCSYATPFVLPLMKMLGAILDENNKFYNKNMMVEFDAEGWVWALGYLNCNPFLLVDNTNPHTFNVIPYDTYSLNHDVSAHTLAQAWLNSYYSNTDAWLGWDFGFSSAKALLQNETLNDEEREYISHKIEMIKAYAQTIEELLHRP